MTDEFDAEAATWDTPEKVARSRAIGARIAQVVPLRPHWRVLDAGCGTGQLMWSLAGRVGGGILLDTSAGMLDVAREHAKRHPGEYSVRQADLTREPLGDHVDLVVSAMTLHHVPDTAALLAAFRDALTPGGWVALADLDADPDNHFHDDDFTGHRGFDRADLLGLLDRLGFVGTAATTATTIRKTKNDVEREFGVFLVTGHLPGGD